VKSSGDNSGWVTVIWYLRLYFQMAGEPFRQIGQSRGTFEQGEVFLDVAAALYAILAFLGTVCACKI
jgi:hypothetical protein